MSGPIGSSQLMYSSAAGDFYSHQIGNSTRFNGTGYLNDARSGDGSNSHGTISCWFKRAKLSSYQYIFTAYEDGNNAVRLTILADDTLEFRGETGGAVKFEIETTRVFRDPAAWYHFVGIIDMDNGTQADRAQVYINGERQTVLDTSTMPADASQTMVLNTGANLRIGAASDASYDYNGLITEFVVIDGTAQAVSDFGETKNGVWIPKNPSGLTFGTNGVYLKMADSSNLGTDSSGNGHTFALTNIDSNDHTIDSPTFDSSSNGGNFCTLNELSKGSNATLSEGGLRASGNSSDGSYVPSTMAFKTGKWYCEFLVIDQLEGWPYVSVCDYENTQLLTSVGQVFAIRYQADGDLEKNDSGNTASFGSITLDSTGLGTYTDGDIIGTYIDCDNKKLWFTKNGAYVNSGDPSAGTNPQASWDGDPVIAFMGATYQNYDYIMNFGQEGSFAGEKTAQGNADGNGYGDFYYTPDTGFLAMCSANIPLADAINPAETDDDYSQKAFDVITYTGNGQARTISTDFKADNIWVKDLDANRRHYLVTNTINANFGTTSYLHPSNAVSEGNASTGITASSSSNFTIGGSQDYVNNNTNNYVAYLWRVNGGTTTALNAGDINATGQINQTHGHGVLLYTGDGGSSNVTMAHGMGTKPEFLWMKDRDSNGNNNQWGCWHHHMADDNYLYLSQDSAQASSSNGVIDTSDVTDTVLAWLRTSTTGGSQTRFENGDNFIIYQFFGVEGHSKFGSFEGNGNADGSFVYLGFSPALVMIKSIDSTSDWEMYDNVRAGYNVDNNQLEVNDEAAQDTNNFLDLLSNGFKLRASSDPNVAETYIYGAWAHNSLKYATAR